MQRSKLFFLQYKTYSCASLLHVFVSTAAKRVVLVSRLYYNNLQTSAPYTLLIYIFLFTVVKTMCECSEINCSPFKFFRGVIVKISFLFILRSFSTYPHTYHELILYLLIAPFNYVCLMSRPIFMVFLYRLQCFNYASEAYLLALPVRCTDQSL